MLNIRAVGQDWCRLFENFYPFLCNRYDLHPCTKVKQLITAFAHRYGNWRRVPSFSLREQKLFKVPEHNQHILGAILLEQVLGNTELGVALENYLEQNSSFSNYREHKVFFESDWSLFSDSELLANLANILALNKHAHLEKLWSAIRTRSSSLQYKVFVEFVKRGVSPYYLDWFLSSRILQRWFSGRDYLTLLFRERNEHLLKQILKKSTNLIVPKGWPRGQELLQKAKSNQRAVGSAKTLRSQSLFSFITNQLPLTLQ